jgi:uncharacterized membrane protein (GlpM family)
MGFVSKMLGSNSDIQIYYIVGLLIFIGLFALILVRTIRMKKSDILAIKTAILDEKEQNEIIHS